MQANPLARHWLWRVVALCLVLCAPPLRADESSPEALMKGLTDEVLNILREDQGIKSGNVKKAASLIESKVAPHFDFARMTSLAVGKSWQQASPQQKTALTQEFRTLLVRTYANSLTEYRGQTVSFKPSGPTQGDEVVVRSQVNKPGARAIPLDYSLHRTADGWKVYDVTVADVSLVTTYRGSFARSVEEGGIDGLLRSLQDKNRRQVVESAAPGASSK